MKFPIPMLLLILAATACPQPAHAAQSYDNCGHFIDSVPTVITAQGVWCLRKDLSTAITAGAAITIAANNVTIDCNDFKLGGLAAGAGTQTNGILAQNRLNATVRHCNIRGFLQGVSFEGANGGGHVVEDNRFDGNTGNGLYVAGDGSVVRRNLVSDTGGSAGSSTGIVTSYAVDVIDNTVSGVQSNTGFPFGIHTEDNPHGSISGNRVRGLVGLDGSDAYGIINSFSGQIRVRDNDVSGDNGSGIGLFCEGTGSAKDNIISGFATRMLGCTDLP